MRYFVLSASLLLLASCASAVDGQTQEVTLRTPGAENARCHLQNEDMKYAIHTNETITIMKSPHDLEVACLAPGNREKTITVARKINDWVAGNAVTGFVPGAAYDYFSRGGFQYPEEIVVDFTGMKIKAYELPAYHTKDLEHNHVNNNVVDMRPNIMITEENRYDTYETLEKRQGLYGEEEDDVLLIDSTGARSGKYVVTDDIHRKYNPQLNYDPAEEDK